jgi:hypothetical protein
MVCSSLWRIAASALAAFGRMRRPYRQEHRAARGSQPWRAHIRQPNGGGKSNPGILVLEGLRERQRDFLGKGGPPRSANPCENWHGFKPDFRVWVAERLFQTSRAVGSVPFQSTSGCAADLTVRTDQILNERENKCVSLVFLELLASVIPDSWVCTSEPKSFPTILEVGSICPGLANADRFPR